MPLSLLLDNDANNEYIAFVDSIFFFENDALF